MAVGIALDYFWFCCFGTFMLALIFSAIIIFTLTGRGSGGPGLLLSVLFLLWCGLFLTWSWLTLLHGQQWCRIVSMVWDGLGVVVLTIFTCLFYGRVPLLLVVVMLACHICDLTLVASIESADSNQGDFEPPSERETTPTLGGFLSLLVPIRATFVYVCVFFYTLIEILAQRMGDIRGTFGLISYFVTLHTLIYVPLIWCIRNGEMDGKDALMGAYGALLAFDAILMVVIHPLLNYMDQNGQYGHMLSILCMGVNFMDLLMCASMLSSLNR